MSSADAVAQDKVVTLKYELKNEDGEVLGTSADGAPLRYLHGHENIVPGLERQLEGRGKGDHFEATVTPAEGYGERQGPGPQQVPMNAFPEGSDPQPGMQFATQDDEGNMIPIWVMGVQGDQVVVDTDHPLAGETLYFDIEVVDVRDSTDQEKQQGHPETDESEQ